MAEVAEKTSWIRKIWPVSRGELRKVLPLLLLKFLVSVAYATLTCMKDTLVVTASHSGAEVIPVLKGWLVFPLSLLFVAAYAKLSNHFKRSTLFYSIITFFLLIIFLYGFVLYPNADLITPHRSANWLTAYFGEKYSHWIAVYRNWFHSLFFLTAELWGQVVIFILYWGFVNHICQVKEAKRTYTLFIAAGDLATVAVGPLVLYHLAKFSGQSFTPALQSLLFYVLLCGIMVIALYWWMNRYVLSDTRFYNPSVMQSGVDQKTKLSLSKSIKHIFSSKYLLSIAILVVGCAIAINMIDLTWKAHLKQLYPSAAQYQAFVAKTTCLVGVVALVTVVFLGGNFLRIFGWHFSAQIPPIVIGTTGITFLLLSCFQKHCTSFAALLGITPLTLLVFFGAFQSVISKVVKWSFFDSTKEMAYIPLDQESKVKGKATIDMGCSRFGKFTSSWTHIFIMAAMGTGSVLVITPYLVPIMAGVTCYWCYSVRYLSRELTKKEAAIIQEERKVAMEESLTAPSAVVKTGSI